MKLALILTFFSIAVYGQDYLVTNKSDTLRGEIKPMSYDQLDRVQVSVNKKKTIYTGLQIKIFSLKGELYRPIQRDNTIRFMKVIKAGFLSLYAYRMENQNTFDGRFLVRRDGPIIDVPNLNFKKTMVAFLSNCPTVKDKINSGDYGRKNLNEIIDDYNAYMETATKTMKDANAQVMEGNRKSQPLEDLRNTVEGLTDFTGKKDAIDIVNDMILKTKDGQPIPNYQIEALKGYLHDHETAKDALDRILVTLNVH